MQFTLNSNVKVLKWAFTKTVTKSLDALVIADLPIMATPILRQLMDTLIGYLVNKLATVAEMQVFFLYTDLRVSAEGRDFIAQAAKHQEILKSGTAAEQAKSEEDLFHAFRTLAMLKA